MTAMWETYTLGDLADFKNGLNYTQSSGGMTLPIVGVGDFAENFYAPLSQLETATIDGELDPNYRLEEGDILIVRSNGSKALVGRSMLVPPLTGTVSYSGFVIRIRVARTQVDPIFLLHFLKSPNTRDCLTRSGGGANISNINQRGLSSLLVPVPPLAEQQRIVGILDEAFEGIATAKANAEKNLQNAHALFESHLQSVFTHRGEGWVETTLGDCVQDISTGPFGSLLHKSDYELNGVPLVNPINIEGDTIVPDGRKTIGKATAKRLERYVLHENDIVIGRRGEIGRCAVVTGEQEGWLCGTGCFMIRPSDKTNPYYLTHLLRSQPYRERLEGVSKRATMPSISNDDLTKLTIVLPPLSYQHHTLELIDSLSEETQRLATIYERKLAALDELKRSVLHRAFSGNI